MADFLLDDVGANPDLPFYRPRDFASRLGLRKTEFIRTTHPAEPRPIKLNANRGGGGGAPKARKPPRESTARPKNKDVAPRQHEGASPIEARPVRSGDTGNANGSLSRKRANGTEETIPAGSRGNETEPTPKKNAKNDKERSSILDKASKGLMFLPLLLPLALLLASVIQGEGECENVNSQTMDVTNVVSAAWPQGLPSWVPQSGTTKYDIGYTPCIKILANDTITFTDSSNTFPSGEFPIDSVPQPCYVRIDFGKELTIDPEVSNVATFKDKTSCADRMAYAAGQDVGIVANAAGEGLSGAASGLFGNINFGTIGMVLLAIVAVYFAIQFARQVI